ncbi:MAG: sodium:proton exchanger, partial [Spirochaetales bacterium]|nr:sodium:proton exchanger [Spirochaetales bacterium]
VSELLSIMTFGCVLVNISPAIAKKGTVNIENYSPVFLAAFFILGGAHLNLRLLGQIGVMGLIYFAARAVGKMGGASLGAVLGKAQPQVKKFIGFTLLPQVGVALALALSISKEFTKPVYGSAGMEMATTIINILLFTTIITEIIGPLLTRFALHRAGEAAPELND